MIRRLNNGCVIKLCLLFGLFCLLYNHANVFFSKIIIVNSSSKTLKHPLAPTYPYPYEFLINQSEKCHERKPFLVLLVIIESHDIISRKAIRETWGDEKNYKEVDVMRLFLVGRSPVSTTSIQRVLKEESCIYNDIVQQDFLDTYNNLTLKVLMGMEWVAKFCPNASYVMKVDADVFLNVEYLVYKLLHPELPTRQNFLTGCIMEGAKPYRDKFSKWYVPEELYPGNIFPPYTLGPGYVFSADMARKIYQVAQEIQVFNIEDAFIGLCLYKLKISPTPYPRNIFFEFIFYDYEIAYEHYRFCHILVIHRFDKNRLQITWLDFWKKKTLC